jgi:phage tail sheath protein FI
MTIHTYPGVYIEELPSGVHTITGVATSIAAFVGWAPQGPTDRATLVQSWPDFASAFGGLNADSLLGYSVNQFFANGGQQAYIVRLAADGNDGTLAAGTATVEVKDSENNAFLTLQAASPGDWATDYGVTVSLRSDDPTRFSLSVVYAPVGAPPRVVESFQNLSLSSADPLYVVNVINADSSYVAFPAGFTPPAAMPPAAFPTTPFMFNGTATPLSLADQTGINYVALQAKTPDLWPANFAVVASKAASGTAGLFDLEVQYDPASGGVGVTLPIKLELMSDLSVDPTQANFARSVIKQHSQFVRVPDAFVFPAAGTIAASITHALPNTGTIAFNDGTNDFLRLVASNPFDWPQNIAVETQANAAGFDLNVVYNPAAGGVGIPSLPVTLETITVPTVDVAGLAAIAASDLVAVPASFQPPTPTPASLTLPLTRTMLVQPLNGSVLQPGTAAFHNRMLDIHGDGTHGVHLLDRVEIFNLLCVPGETNPTTIAVLQTYCRSQRAFYIVDCRQTDNFASLQGGPTGLTGPDAINSAFYFPWVNAPDPLQQGRMDAYPPCGFVAGIYAATDATRGVWKAPAGIDAGLSGASGLTVPLTDLQNGTLNVQAINCLRNFSVYGNVVWGARTLRGDDRIGSEWKYVPIRRFALFLESSLYDSTQWVVFEPNDEPLWGQIRLNVGAFMQGLFLQGAFQGTTPQQAYFVKCDGENNPPSSIAHGVVNILVGFAPLFPAEFVVIQIQQIAGQAQA